MGVKFTVLPNTLILNSGSGTKFHAMGVPYSSAVAGQESKSGTGVCSAKAIDDKAMTRSPITIHFLFMVVASFFVDSENPRNKTCLPVTHDILCCKPLAGTEHIPAIPHGTLPAHKAFQAL
jgi:hypothetical protein